jgi:uncharacterized protein (TIGR02246 family)
MEREMVSDVAQIYDVWKAYGSAVYEGDLNRWLALWIDDSKRLAPNAPASVGLEQIRIAVEPLFELFDFEAFGVNPDEVQILGDQAYSHGTYGFSMMPKAGGDVIEDRGKFLTILEKQVDGSWKIAVDCFNSDLPKP